MRHRFERVGRVVLAAAAVSCLLVLRSVQAQTVDEGRPLFRPELARAMTQQERWALDAELANEIHIMRMNSRRFLEGNPFEQRARWAEDLGKSYKLADLVQQLVDFRRSAMRPNEDAFEELVQRGRAGDVGAKCLAAFLYPYFPPRLVGSWSFTYSQLLREAMKAKDSGHPVCAGLAGSVYLRGAAGYAKDRAKAKQGMVAGAVAGFYGYRMLLAEEHWRGAAALDAKEAAPYLCWLRTADEISPHAGFRATCAMYRIGLIISPDLKEVKVPPRIQAIAREWCEASKEVSARTCAELEASP